MKFPKFAALILVLILAVTMASAQEPPGHLAQLQKDHEELQSYTLTMDIVARAFSANHESESVIKADRALQASMKKARGKGDTATIDQLSAALSASPKIIAVVEAHGLTPRTLALALTSIIQTEISMGALENGKPIAELPLIFQGNAMNIKLFREHKEELLALNEKYPMTLF